MLIVLLFRFIVRLRLQKYQKPVCCAIITAKAKATATEKSNNNDSSSKTDVI